MEQLMELVVDGVQHEIQPSETKMNMMAMDVVDLWPTEKLDPYSYFGTTEYFLGTSDSIHEVEISFQLQFASPWQWREEADRVGHVNRLIAPVIPHPDTRPLVWWGMW